ncbi:MAG TPA: pyridoxal phosphate-dependent aminotransferase [Actinomycetota bacterium]|nr:pyridoxal phosphate-dependent aminotransferase [Actinomycetota bacterium]
MQEPSSRSAAVRPFLVMELLDRARAMQDKGLDIVHLEVGEPDLPAPAAATRAGMSAVREGRTRYTPSAGLPELRAELARTLAIEHDVDIDPARVLITTGSSAALLLSFAATTEPGDEVLLADPGYPCYANILRTLGVTPRYVPVVPEQGWVLDPEMVCECVSPRTAAIVVNSPANPTGAIVPRDALASLADAGPRVICDEIYQGLTYGQDAASILAVSSDAYAVGGFSKRYAMTGWRVGYLVAPTAHVGAVSAMQQNLYISAPEAGQLAAPAALGATEETGSMRRTFEERRAVLLRELARIGLDVPVAPAGAFYVFVDMRRFTEDSLAFAHDLLLRGHVAVTPGIDFGPRGEGWIRLSYAASTDRLVEGVRRIGSYLEEL